jgi:lysosomal acid lipase/cholesteryl ester hydrolase
MDQFAFHDIPDSINYILKTTSQPSLSYIGFSQGTAQAFATLSIHPTLNDKVDVFIALAPAMSPAGLSNGVVDALMKASPEVVFLAFGRRSILSSATMWQQLLYPPIFTRVIDMSLSFLFGWSGKNITMHQKLAAYPHLYSFTSTKSVVHWFQIIRTKSFQMYDDEVQPPLSLGAADRYYKVAKFPTRNIKTPIVLVYGGSDSLVDIKVMMKQLPRHTVAKEIPHFEHLDFLWAHEVHTLVFPHVFSALEEYAGRDHLSTFKYLPGGARGTALGQSSEYSEDDLSSLTTDTEVSGMRMEGQATASKNVHSPLRAGSAADWPASPAPSDPGKEGNASPTNAGSNLANILLKSNTKHKRIGSLSSQKSIDRIKRFGNGGISVGTSKATVGDVAAPKLEESELETVKR